MVAAMTLCKVARSCQIGGKKCMRISARKIMLSLQIVSAISACNANHHIAKVQSTDIIHKKRKCENAHQPLLRCLCPTHCTQTTCHRCRCRRCRCRCVPLHITPRCTVARRTPLRFFHLNNNHNTDDYDDDDNITAYSRPAKNKHFHITPRRCQQTMLVVALLSAA